MGSLPIRINLVSDPPTDRLSRRRPTPLRKAALRFLDGRYGVVFLDTPILPEGFDINGRTFRARARCHDFPGGVRIIFERKDFLPLYQEIEVDRPLRSWDWGVLDSSRTPNRVLVRTTPAMYPSGIVATPADSQRAHPPRLGADLASMVDYLDLETRTSGRAREEAPIP